MEEKEITKEEVIKKFGVDPEKIGLRHRYWFILDRLDEEDEEGGAQIGYLCVCARDGGANPIDINALKIPNCVGTTEDLADCTYRYYYFKPLEGGDL